MTTELRDPLTHPHPFVTVEMLARYWCVSEQFVYRQIDKGALPAIRVGRLLRVRVKDVVRYGEPTAYSS